MKYPHPSRPGHPPMLEWRDVTAKAPTGTGKRLLFGIPNILTRKARRVQGCDPGADRELALQITDELRDLAVFIWQDKIGSAATGGQPIGKQINALKRNPQIIVANAWTFQRS